MIDGEHRYSSVAAMAKDLHVSVHRIRKVIEETNLTKAYGPDQFGLTIIRCDMIRRTTKAKRDFFKENSYLGLKIYKVILRFVLILALFGISRFFIG